MLSFSERLDNFLKYKGLNDNQVTIEAGLANGIIGKSRRRGALSQDNIAKLLHTYPELNANWLIVGKGEMLFTPPAYKQESSTSMPSEPQVEYKKVSDKDKYIILLERENKRLITEIEKKDELLAAFRDGKIVYTQTPPPADSEAG